MFNIKFVNEVEKHPVLYNFTRRAIQEEMTLAKLGVKSLQKLNSQVNTYNINNNVH